MLTSVKRQNDDLRMRLQDLQKLFLDHDDSKAAASIADLEGKAEEGELTLAFADIFRQENQVSLTAYAAKSAAFESGADKCKCRSHPEWSEASEDSSNCTHIESRRAFGSS